MPPVWDETRQKDLLEEIYFRTYPQLSLDDKNAIVQGMEHRGHTDITWNAIRQHLQKLKRKDNASGNGNGEAATPKKARTTPKKRGKAADEDADSETPKTKKRRGPNKKAAAADDEDVDEEKGSFVKDEDDDSC